MNTRIAKELIKAALAGDSEKAQYLLNKIDQPEGLMFDTWLNTGDDELYWSGDKMMTAQELIGQKTIDERMGYPWLEAKLTI